MSSPLFEQETKAIDLADKTQRWSIDRRPSTKRVLPPEITTLRLPRAVRCKDYDDISVTPGAEVFDLIYQFYSSYLPEPERYENFCGDRFAVRRHEALWCDPYFGGFVFCGEVANLVMYDNYLKATWCLEALG